MDLAGKVVFITGGSAGIGEALAHELVDAGARVVLFARRQAELDRVVRAIGDEWAVAVAGDVTRPEDLRRAVTVAIERFGGLDILVNNAGMGVIASIATVPPDLMEQCWRVNVLGYVHAIQAAVPAIRLRGDGLIVNISSIAGVRASPTLAPYASTKAAIDHISSALRRELKDDGIRVLNVYPGYLDNDFMNNAIYSGDSDYGRKIAAMSRTRKSADAARDIVDAIRNNLDEFLYGMPSTSA